MSIHSTIKSLYAIACEAQKEPSEAMKMLLRTISDDDVSKAVSELEYLLGALNDINTNMKGMYILHYTTGTDRENKNVLLQTEVVFGNGTIKFTTQFDEKAAQSLIEAMQMSLAMVRAGDKLSQKEGRA